jgi:AcrR family transcriptional regulator
VEAALALFGERGIDAASMDAIAEKSGVSKATIYKHWQDKDALALEALSLMFGLDEEPPRFDSGDLCRDLVDALTYQPAAARQRRQLFLGGWPRLHDLVESYVQRLERENRLVLPENTR